MLPADGISEKLNKQHTRSDSSQKLNPYKLIVNLY